MRGSTARGRKRGQRCTCPRPAVWPEIQGFFRRAAHRAACMSHVSGVGVVESIGLLWSDFRFDLCGEFLV